MRPVVICMSLCLFATPAFAQREAISSALSPEAAAEAFADAVLNTCVPAAAGSGVAGLPSGVRARLQASSDPETRKQSGAAAGEAVWDVMSAKGVVTIHDGPGRCVVSVYGPPAMQTVMGLAGRLTQQAGPFERLASAPPSNGYGQSLIKTEGGKRIMVQLTGSEPGTPGHQSRFSVVTATVFATPAG